MSKKALPRRAPEAEASLAFACEAQRQTFFPQKNKYLNRRGKGFRPRLRGLDLGSV